MPPKFRSVQKRFESRVGYELLLEIGSGSFARVYLARRRGYGLSRYVAIKIVHVGDMPDQHRAVIVEEAQITGNLFHPNILHVYDCGILGGKYFFIVTELLDGFSLKQVITQHSKLVRERLGKQIPVSLMRQAAASVLMHTAHGISYIHGARDLVTGRSLKVIHNDLKPSNILIGMNGALKVSDFGISYSPLRTVRLKGGTPAYMSPEWIQSLLDDDSQAKPTTALDIYSLGICMYETLTAQRLFTAPREGMERKDLLLDILRQMRAFQPGHTQQVNPAAGSTLCDIVDRCLRFEPAERYQSMEEIISEIDILISKGIFHPEILDRRFLAKYMSTLFEEGVIRQLIRNRRPDLMDIPSSPSASLQV